MVYLYSTQPKAYSCLQSQSSQHSKSSFFLMLHTICVIVKIRAVKIQRRMTLSMTTFIVKLRGYFLSVGLKRKSILCKVKVALTCSGNTFTHCTSSVVTTAMTSEMPWRVNWNQGVVLL